MATVAEATDAVFDEACARLRGGGLVAFPTETVYGLGADTFSSRGLEAVYALKGRPADNPLIAHVSGTLVARNITIGWDERCDRLAERFWPGPLTIVLDRAANVPPEAAGGRDSLAVRAPRHPLARRLLEAFGGAISAPSANRSGHVSPTSASHVAADFPEADLLILQGGPCTVGIESTVLDMREKTPRLLRPGSVTVSEIEASIGPIDARGVASQSDSPGTTAAHYAPETPAELVEPEQLAAHLDNLEERAAVLCFDVQAVRAPHHGIEMPQGAGDYGAHLYEALRRADAVGVDRIVIEMPPQTNQMWDAVLDRLARACTGA